MPYYTVWVKTSRGSAMKATNVLSNSQNEDCYTRSIFTFALYAQRTQQIKLVVFITQNLLHNVIYYFLIGELHKMEIP